MSFSFVCQSPSSSDRVLRRDRSNYRTYGNDDYSLNLFVCFLLLAHNQTLPLLYSYQRKNDSRVVYSAEHVGVYYVLDLTRPDGLTMLTFEATFDKRLLLRGDTLLTQLSKYFLFIHGCS